VTEITIETCNRVKEATKRSNVKALMTSSDEIFQAFLSAKKKYVDEDTILDIILVRTWYKDIPALNPSTKSTSRAKVNLLKQVDWNKDVISSVSNTVKFQKVSTFIKQKTK